MIPAASRLMNRILQWDQHSYQKLLSFSGKSLQLNIAELPFPVSLQIDQQGLRCSLKPTVNANTIITGDAFNFYQAFAHPENPYHLKIEGDLELVNRLRQVLQTVEIDWEEQLSKVIGDIPAHQLCRVVKHHWRWQQQCLQNLKQTVAEYLQEELLITPGRQELNDFYSDVDILRNDVERMVAKVNLLL